MRSILTLFASLHILCLLSTNLWAQQDFHFQTLSEKNIKLPTQNIGWEAKQYLKRNFSQLQMEGMDLILSSYKQSLGGHHLNYIQSWKGIPIEDAGIRLKVGYDGQLKSCMNHLVQLPFEQPINNISAKVLLDNCRKAYPGAQLHSQKIWYQSEKGFQLGLHIQVIKEEEGKNFSLTYDLSQGQLIQRKELQLPFRPMADTAKGVVFLPNPCTRADVDYGDLFLDLDDMHQVAFEAFMDTVILNELSQRNGSYFLEGPYVSIQDIMAPNIQPVNSTDGLFFFTRDQSGFEDVMCYYHMDRYQRYVQQLGFLDLYNRPLRVDSHGGTGDNSFFSPNGMDSFIRFGTGGVDDAEDGDVIVHEYCHALEFDAAGSFGGVERLGLAEGNADYVAASYSQDLEPNRWESIFNWDGHNEYWDGTMGISEMLYPPRPYNPNVQPDVSRYVNEIREIWVATLMQIRNEIGAEACDKLFFESMYSYTPGISLLDAVQIMLQADQDLFGGAYEESLRFFFCSRGLLAGPECLSVNVIPETQDYISWQVYPNPSKEYVYIERNTDTPASLSIYNLNGQLMKRIDLRSKLIEIDLDLPSGLYILHIQEDNVYSSPKKLLIY